MSALERFERIGKLGLIGIFLCSTLLFGLFLFRILYSWNHIHTVFPLEKAFNMIVGALFFLSVFLGVWRHLRLKTLAAKNSSLRSVLKDEHTRTNWLKAFRPAFFLLLTIQLASKIPIMIWRWPWDVPYQSPLSLSVAAMALTGAFLYFNRGSAHE
jgi:hypothetical protein